MTTPRMLLVLTCSWLAVSAAQDPVAVRMARLLEYTGLDHTAPEDVSRMAALWTRAQQPGLSHADRRLAFRDMYLLFGKLHGRDMTSRPQALDGLAEFVTGTFEAGGRMDLTLPEPRGTPEGRYLHVETRGRGPASLLLISDLGIDGRRLYESFAARQADACTMHIVTLPYAGAARPLPWPARLDYPARPWLTAIERELLALVDEPRFNRVTVVGTAAGGYFAARLALARPKRIRAVVLVNALVATSMRAPGNPDATASFAERLSLVKTAAPTPQLIPIAPVPPSDELRRRIADPASAHPTARNWMAFATKDDEVSRAWTFEALTTGFFVPSLEYRWELTSTDLSEQLPALTVPALAMGSWHDEGSPAQNTPTISQWEEMKLRAPAIPLTIVSFADTRHYISADAPAEFDRALADFLAGRTVRGTSTYTLPRSSPRASVMQSAGTTEIEIVYGRPAVNGRTLWGEVVPNGRVWRAGANEATTVRVSRDVMVSAERAGSRQPGDARRLAAGTYTFFVIPGDGEWTAIFNRVPRQWGAFDYNPAFDALRFNVPVDTVTPEEHLRYSIQPAGAAAAIVTLAWDIRAISFRVEAIP
jgi:pimeloyl-ACP methyl ester carboxylesterase